MTSYLIPASTLWAENIHAAHADIEYSLVADYQTKNRMTSGGRLLGTYERIGVLDALRAVTLGAAYTLKLDGEVGSIETGKRADFAVLNDDPLTVAPEALRDVGVWGVVQGGRIFPANTM